MGFTTSIMLIPLIVIFWAVGSTQYLPSENINLAAMLIPPTSRAPGQALGPA